MILFFQVVFAFPLTRILLCSFSDLQIIVLESLLIGIGRGCTRLCGDHLPVSSFPVHSLNHLLLDLQPKRARAVAESQLRQCC